MSDNPEETYDIDELEAYCMTCRQKTPVANPEPIWTRRGAPGTRGTCAECGTTVFVMGWTNAHARLKRPEPVRVSEGAPRGGRKIPHDVTYINYSVSDVDFVTRLAEDLNRIGIQTWLAESNVKGVQWATGVHPALVECKHMIVVLSSFGIKATNVTEALDYFLETGKPIVVVQVEQDAEVPDELRRKPRFDFSGDNYKSAFRELVQVLTG
jgi:hypothetical protein